MKLAEIEPVVTAAKAVALEKERAGDTRRVVVLCLGDQPDRETLRLLHETGYAVEARRGLTNDLLPLLESRARNGESATSREPIDIPPLPHPFQNRKERRAAAAMRRKRH